MQVNTFQEIEDEIISYRDQKLCILLMSGGIDSSVSLVLLKEQWYHVIWIHYNFWHAYKTNKDNKCCNLSDLRDAQIIADKYQTKLFNIDLQKDFYKAIIEPFINAKSQGIHINPCTYCHQYIKYWKIFDLVKKYNIFIASWYYCHIKDGKLSRPKDIKKNQNQSIILCLKPEDLKYMIFPLWPHLKSEVRSLAQIHWLHIQDKAESMGLCFVWEKTVKDFIKSHCDLKPADIYYFDWINQHPLWSKCQWLWLYQIWEKTWFCNPESLYVYNKDILNGKLILSHKKHLLQQSFTSTIYNLLYKPTGKTYQIQFNSNLPPITWHALLQDERLIITFLEPIDWVIPWEIFLIFDKELILWWWIIQS